MKTFSDDLPNSSKETQDKTLEESEKTHVLANEAVNIAKNLSSELYHAKAKTSLILWGLTTIIGGTFAMSVATLLVVLGVIK